MAVSGAAVFPACGDSFKTCKDSRTCPAEKEEEPDDGNQCSNGDPTCGGHGGEGMGEGGSGADLETCEDPEVLCDEACIDPGTDVTFCGASGTCTGDSVGVTCASDELCVDGICEFDCGEGLLFCDETCVDPLVDNEYCGASSCETGEACSDGAECVGGVCRTWGQGKLLELAEGDAEFAPVVRMLGDGEAVLATVREGEGTGGIALTTRYLPEQDTWTLPVEHSVTNSLPLPWFVMNESGQGFFGWAQIAATTEGPNVAHVATRADSGDWTMPFPLSEPGIVSSTSTPQICVDDEGNALAIWRQNSSPAEFHAARQASSADAWEALGAVLIDAETVLPTDWTLQPLGAGRCLFTMFNSEAEGERLYFSVGSIGEGFTQIAAVDGAPVAQSVLSVFAHGNGRGTAAIAWSEAVTPPFHAIVFDGDVWSESVTVASDAGTGGLIGVLVDPFGIVTVLSESWAWTYDEGEQSFGAGMRSVEPPEFRDPAVAVDGFGNIQVVWGEQASGAISLWGARWSPYRGEWSAPRLLEETASPVEEIDVEFNSSGQGIVVWWAQTSTIEELGYNYFQ